MSLLKYPGQYLDKIIPITERRGTGSSSYTARNVFYQRYGTTGIAYTDSNGLATWSSGVGDVAAHLIVPFGGAATLGKKYVEFEIVNVGSQTIVGIQKISTLSAASTGPSQNADGYMYASTGSKFNNATGAAYGASYTTGNFIGVLLDSSASTLSVSFTKNGVNQGVAYSGITQGAFAFMVELGSGSTTSVRVPVTPTYPPAGYTLVQ